MMPTCILDLAPFLPSDEKLKQSGLPDKALDLKGKAAGLGGQLSPVTAATLRRHMEVINSYYSNLIEGNRTQPHEIRLAQQGDFSTDPVARDLQQESLAHIQVQSLLAERQFDAEKVFSADTLRWLHKAFYERLPDRQRQVSDPKTGEIEKVEPGQYRRRTVSVGHHIPPSAEDLPTLVDSFFDTYKLDRHAGTDKIIAVMAAHHRLVWIHPFLDGNGRVARLWTDEALKAAGLESVGVWCLSRGLARNSERYKGLLHRADHPRQDNQDGRGALSEQALMEFCDYMLEQALDQVSYIGELLHVQSLRHRIGRYVDARNDGRVPGQTRTLKAGAARVLFAAFQEGELARSEALALTGEQSERNARRLLSQLRDEGLLSETSNRSPLRWEIPEHAEPWYFPQLTPGV